MADDIFTSEPERIIAQRNHVHDLDRLAADRLEEENDPVATIARFSSANVSGGVREGLSISDAIDRLAEERMQRENLVKWQLVQASQTNPDAEARLQQRARQIGLPADVARDDPETVAMKAYRKQLEGKDFGNAPATLEVLSDPDVAKVAHDDTDNMFDLDNWHKYNPLAFALDAVRSLGAGLIGGSIRGTGGMVSTQVRAFPVSGVINDAEVNAQIMGYDTGNANERVAEAVKQGEELAKASGVDEIYNTGKEWTDAIRGDVSGYGFIGKSVLSGFESMGAMIPGMALSFVTKNPLPGLTAAGMMEGSDAIMEDLKAGKPFGEAILHGVINGSIEVGTEAIPMSKLINDVDIGKKLFSVLIRNWIRETPSEMIATAGQTLSDRIFAMKDGEPLSGTITQWAKELPAAEAETVLATMVMSFGMGAFGKGVRQIQTRQMSEAVASLNDNAKASKVRGRAKEIYERLAQTVGKNENIDNAYIDAERWNEYFQEIGEDPHAMAERFGVTNYEDGSVGSFLQIPFGKYQSDFSATEYAQAFVNDTKFSDTERTASEQARFIEKTKEELAETLRTLDEESGRATLVKDAIGRLTDKIAIQLENTYDKQTSRLQAEVLARMFSNTVVNDAISRGEQATPEALADMVDALFSTEGPSIRSGTGMRKRSVDPAIDAQLEKLRRNELPKERNVYGQSLMEYIRKKGGIRPDDITRDLVKNKQLPRSILNEKGMGADELASLQDVLDFGIETEAMQGDNALLDALVAEYTTGEKRYSNTQLNSELLSEAQTLNDLSRDLAAAGIALSTHTDNAAIREALSKYYEEQNGENTREEPETSETLRYEQRGFTESDTPTAEERAEADRQYDEIEKKYKGTPLWMKAPNGEPTKLSERQWVQVRTLNFKRWFGDWEKAGIRERLENQEPVLVEAKYHIENSKERKAKAVELLDEDITVQKAIGPVNISKSGIRKSFGHSTSDAKLDVIPHLREILEKAEYLDTLNDFDGKDIQNHYFAARITHDGQNKIVFLRARKMPGRGNQLYVHDVFVEDEIKQKAGSPLQIREYGEKAISHLRGSDLYKSILQDIYATDNESISKVVDSNGEPMVMYHQTRSRDITVFDIRRKGAGETDPETPFGVFLKPTDADIGLGNVQMALFANIRNPARFRNRESVERYLGEKADGYAQRRDWLRATDKDYLTKYEQAEAEADRILEEWEKNHPDSTEKEREEIFDKAYATADSVMDEWKTETDRISKEAKDIADNWFRKEGYDGFVLDEDSGSLGRSVQTTVALSNKQVKSATGNIGTFTDNPNILYQSFGDENVPVVRLTGDELGVPIEAPLKEHIKAAKKYHDVLREESKTNPVIQKQLGKPVRFSAKGFKENAHSGADKRKWALFPKLREIIESSVLIETRNVKKQRKDNFTKFHWVEAPVNLNGKTLTVGITLAEDAEGNLFYNLNAEADSTRSAQKKETPSHFPGSQDQDYEGADSTSVLTQQQSQDVGGIPDTASDVLEQSIGQNGDGVNLFISKGKTARGDIRGSYDYVNNIIRLTKAADYSTFVHESAHFMLEMVARMANQESASSYITKQYDTICEYLGAKKGERFTREQHETFARSFEAYLKEGKAPTPAVRNLFAKFADWLKHIYRSVSLHVTLNKDIREVFDRMIATEAELEMAKKQKEYTELFATAENAGLTREEFDLYRKTGEKELRIAQEKRRAKIFARAVRKKTKEYRIRKKAMERQVAADYDAMPIIRLMDALSDKDHPELAFNKGGLIDRYGKAYIGKLPRRNGRAIYHADGLMDLDDVAIDAGYESGDDLLRAWQELPTKKEFVAAETEKRLAETDRQMDYDVASEALDNEGHDERLKAELAIIRRLATFGKKAVRLHVTEEAKRRKTQITAIERDVRDQTEAMVFVAGDIIRNKTTGDIHPEMYRRAMQKAADQAYREIRKTKPDYEKAARAKQAEMMNHFLFREAMKARREIERGTRKAKRVLNVKTETYRNWLDSLNANKAKFIAASLLGSVRKEALLDAVHTEEKYEKEAAAQWLYDVGPMKTTPYRDVLIALDDMDAYYHDAQREKQVVIAGRRMDAIDVAGDLAEKVRQVGKSKYVTDNVRSVKNDVIDGLHFTKNILTRMEHLCYFFDGDRKGVGPWLKNVFAPTLAAGVRYRQRRDAVAKEFSEILDGFEFRKGVIHSEELDFTFGKGRRSSTGYAKAEIVALILQTGTESNLKKLLAGYGWTVVDWNRFIARMQQERILTEADMDRVQRIWDLFEANKEKSQRAYKYVYGRYFEEIPARPFMMFGKMYKGGYAPLVYDSRETDAGKKQESDFKEDMQALFPAPDAGFAKSRTEYIGELSLDIMRIQRGFKDQILFSEMGPVYADLQKIFRQPELSKALREYDDRLYARVIDPWMKRAVHQSIDTGRERSAADRIFRSLRNISSVTTMAGNVVNAVEGLTDVPAAVKVVGFRSFSDATKQFMASPRESQRMIRELSPYMNERMSAAYASLDARLEESVNPNKIQRWNRFISDHAFFVQTVFDRFIICPTWIASYNNALARGLTEEDAILKADSDVRRVQSDYSPESLSNLEAGSPFVRLFTQFTSYFITRGNLVASESSVAIRQGASKLAVMFGWMLMAGIPAWLSKALQMAASGSDDDREFSDWIVEIFGLGSLDYVLSMTGAGRYAATMINDIQQGRRFNYPAPGPFRALESLYSLAENRAKGDPVKLTQYLIEVSNAMPYTPVIPIRPVKSVGYVVHAVEGKIEPTGPVDFVRGAVTGRASPDSRK